MRENSGLCLRKSSKIRHWFFSEKQRKTLTFVEESYLFPGRGGERTHLCVELSNFDNPTQRFVVSLNVILH